MTDSNNNDRLEEFFQQKVKEYDIAYREEDWRSLEHRLDALDAQFAARKRRRLAAAAVILVFSVLAYFTYQNYQQLNELNQQISQSEQLSPSLPGESHEELPATIAPEQSAADQSNSEAAERNTLPTTADAKASSANTQTTGGTVQQNSGYLNQSLAYSGVACPDCDLSSLENENGISYSALQMVEHSQNYREPASPAVRSTSGISAQQTISSRSRSPRASLGVVFGPDISTVGSMANFYNPGYKIGITFDYNISRNWGISVGAIRSNVRYKATGQEYQPPQGYWNYGMHADHTIGECLLIDIPIHLTYRFLHFDRSRMYATAGFSTYIMLNEEYRFNYDTYQTGLPQQWNESTGTTHFMNNASFSVGYELDIGHNISLRAEPFLKVPIKEVGWGNVRLYSVGTLVSLNYQFR